jgi:hypothetical protein
MTEKRMLIVDDELLNKIDENRGEMSRTEFLSFIISNQFGEKESLSISQSVSSDYVSRAEYLEFTQGMKDLLRHFFDFFIKNDLKQEGQPGNGSLAELTQKLQALSASKFKPKNIK